MDVKELRIGDWIYCWAGKSLRTEYEACALCLDDFKFFADNGWTEDDFNELLKPIPLTKEILDKNFKWSQDRLFWYCEENCNVGIEEYNNSLNLVFSDWETDSHLSHKLEYVHQLQNFLRDFGIEKEIEI